MPRMPLAPVAALAYLHAGTRRLPIRQAAADIGCLNLKATHTMTTHNNFTTTPAIGSNVSDLSARVAERADKAIDVTQRVTDNAANALHSGLDTLRNEMPFALSKAGASADALLAEGAERARQASAALRLRSSQVQQQAAAYVRAKPLTAMLWVAGAAALVTLLLTRSSGRR